MSHVIGEHYLDLEIEEITHEHGDSPTEQSEQIRSMHAPPCSAVMMPGSRAALMAVVDENGYLIPVFTANDLLRRCKSFWRASQD